MNKLVLVVLSMLVTSSVFAAHGPAGCGLGAVLFKDKKGIVFQILAATFNGSSGNQTFAMSTGTLGCEDAQTAKVTAISFIDNNLVALSNDISKGEGQTLNAYLTLINATLADKNTLKANYGRIFSEGNTSLDIHNTISELVKL
ncbi:MAG: hypothetical protein A2381_04185 [Bdellovibrionales bacterium RIFOXYB1_FULL_37_110]|nr:MAG: hypothetical protein A2417_03450 [Bdellovibrionales bacterium RIFOXYC1_FULL_37_79]OFZ53456.1 MAG: hypothetical protein A2328_05145 [Bdellovibrionales bacterium RIFOXYB2_FULL_36_6]OFZ57390.1 MAG: hypothetical protein A2381_04185 [Bdellovibrionales bacterium RIFOXYB1_FULL_37_110]OFZ64951.1 MAG: hypothetical protein A2577_02670 [Bdellovibrionales bacterium RIFOXYD1_FULL_36_51]